MKEKLLSALTAISFTVGFVPQCVFAVTGSGTEASPYIISDAAGLAAIHNNLSASYKLGANIDMSGVAFTPIGNETEGAFTGTLDGNGFSIKNLTIDSAYKSVGLIGYLEGTLTNITLDNAQIKGYRYTGGIAGYAEEGSNISSCTISGIVDGGYSEAFTPFTGGIVGYTEAETVSNCTNNAYVSSSLHDVGGIVGYSKSDINGCVNTGTIKGKKAAGGIAGNNSGTITDGTNSGTIITDSTHAGGIAGYSLGKITSGTNTGTITGVSAAGGIAGYSSETITSGTNFGEIKSTSKAGGIVGDNKGTIASSNNSGNVSASSSYAGGIAGYSTGTINSASNSGNVSTSSNYAGGIAGIGRGNVNNCDNNGTVLGTYAGGIIGYISSETIYIENCHNYGAIGNGNGDYQGGILGYGANNDAARYIYITNCSNNGNVKGNEYIGGMVGDFEQSSGSRGLYIRIKNGINNAAIVGNSYVGGMVGSTDWRSTPGYYNCLNTGSITGGSVVYGIGGGIGYNCVNKGLLLNTSGGSTNNMGCTVYNIHSNQSSISLAKGQTSGVPLELYSYDRELTWTSGDESIATVNSDGIVTGVGEGTTIITAATELGLTATTTVTVSNIDSTADIAALNKTTASLVAGEQVQLTAEMKPAGAQADITWASGNTAVATVDSSGLVTAVKSGVTTITARVGTGQIFYCVINVISDNERVEVQSLSIPKSSIMLAPGDAAALNAEVLPSDATDKYIIYTSDNEDVAVVNAQGIVTAKAAGTAMIRAQSTNGCYDDCMILVTDASGASLLLTETKAFPAGQADMSVNIIKNPGIAAYKLTINYDDTLLTPEEIIPNEDFGGTFTTNLDDEDREELNVLWYNNEDVDINGELFKISFRVNDEAETGDSGKVSVSYEGKDICNSSGDGIGLYTGSASVIVAETLPGDVYEDGEITVYDLTLLSRYITGLEQLTDRQLEAGDVNDDGDVDIKDVVKLAQYIVGRSGVTLMSEEEKNNIVDILVGTAMADENGEAYIPVSIANNNGVAGFRFNIDYDSDEVDVLEIIADNDLLKENLQTNLGNENGGGLIVTWYNDSDISVDGTLFIIKVRYKGDTSSDISIREYENNMCNELLENVSGRYESGKVLAKVEATEEPSNIFDYSIDDIVVDEDTVSVQITSNGNTEGKLIVASYDINGRVVGIATADVSSETRSVPIELSCENAVNISAFIWDDISTQKPLSAKLDKKLNTRL